MKRKPTPRVMVCAVSPQMKKPSSSADVSCSSASSAMVRSCTSSMTTLCSGEWRRGCVLRWKTYPKARVSWMASPFARLPRWQSWEGRQVAHVVQAILLLLLEVLLEGVVRGGPHRGLERRLLAREREVLIAREVA